MSEVDDEVVANARTADQAIAQLCRDTIQIPDMTPAGVSDTIANLAALAAALPQACSQLGRVLTNANVNQVLHMDSLTDETDVDHVIGVAQIHLEETRERAVELYKLLDAAHQLTAHIVSDGPRGETPDE